MLEPKYTLYHYWRSSCSWRVRWALEWKGIEFETKVVNLLEGEQNSDEYKKRNPLGLVPCLVTEGFQLSDSMAILEWLEETDSSRPLLPKSLLEKAKVRQLAHAISSETQPIQNLAVQAKVSKEKSERLDWARFWIMRGFEAYENQLVNFTGDFSWGKDLTVADLCLVPQVYNAKRFNVDMTRFPKIDAIYTRCLELPSCQAAHPDRYAPADASA